MRNLLAFDLGASNGRAILGRFDGTRVTLHELHRFENNYIEMNGVFYWDLPYLYQQLKLGFLAFRQANMGELDCFGIDAWGVDYGLLDKNGHLLSNPRAYRYARDEDMAEVWKQLDFADIFARTGIAAMNFNTIFQLMRRRCEDDAALQNAETLLLMPDLLGYFLTDEKASEYRWALERLEDIKGHRIDRLHIVGGGSQNRFLNQLAADAIDRPVITGPVEGAALGNILAQAMALGDIKSIDDLRDVVRESVDMETYTPNHTLGWEAAYRKLCDFYKELSS